MSIRKLDHAIYRSTEILTDLKKRNFSIKKNDICLIFAQNIDCGYTLEPPRRGGSNEYPQSMFWSKIRKISIPLHTPVLLHVYVKVGFEWVYVTWTCYRYMDMLS